MSTNKNTIAIQATYEIKDELGKGNFGTVFLVRHQEMRRDVAIKVLTNGEGKFVDLQHEAWVQGKLGHPNVVSVFDFAVIDNKGHLVMEYVEKPLQKILEDCSTRRVAVSLDFALRIIRGCMEGLAHAHYSGIVHGDIKPGNILIASSGDPKLSDFGLARLLGTPALRKQGSARWAAPEVLRSWNKDRIWACDYQSDLFSLGVVAYLLLTGRHPFVDPAGVLSIEDVILRDEFQPSFPNREIEMIPERYARMVMKLIQKDKRKRYTSAEEALSDLEERPLTPCTRCEGLNPDDAVFCNWCGKDLKSEKEKDLSPTQRIALAAHELFTSGQDDKGLAKIEELLQAEKDKPEAWCYIGYTFNNYGWYKDAIVTCSKAIEMNKDFAPGYQTRGFAKSNMGEFKEAINDFTKALDIVGQGDRVKRSQILYQRGYAYWRMGKMTEACKDATESLECNATNDRASWLARNTCKK